MCDKPEQYARRKSMNDPEKNVLKNKILRPKKGHAKMSA
jgi:hypothetical protein